MNRVALEIFKSCIDCIMRFLYWMCMIFPIKKNKIFVNCFDGGGWGDNPKYIIKEVLSILPQTDVVWLYKGSDDCEIDGIRYVKKLTLKALYHQATSRVWISTVRMPYYSIKRKNQVYIQTWHSGYGVKKIEKSCEKALPARYIRRAKHDSKMIDYYVSQCRDMSQVYLRDFWYSGGEIMEIGIPRNDIFFDIKKVNFKSNSIKKELGVLGKNIALYAPTFRVDDSTEAYSIDFDKAAAALKERFGGEWVFAVRFHPNIAEKANRFVEYGEKIINVSRISDAQELLCCVDFLITDYSSIVFDYMTLERPAALYATDINDYINDRDFHIRLEDTPFEIARNNKELVEIIKDFNCEEYKEKVRAFEKKYGSFDTGCASEKVAQLIKEIIQ